MLKMLDLFSGVGVGVAAQAVGGIEEYGVEIMPAAIATRDGLGFNTPYNDVWEIDKAQELGFGPDWAMWASPPCFGAGTPVLTRRGSVKIEDVVIGDYVWTHQNRWRKVIDTMNRTAEAIQIGPVVTTPDHPFFSRQQWRKWRTRDRRGYEWGVGDESSWVHAGESKGHFWATPLEVRGGESAPDSLPNPWIAGRYVADGWIGKDGLSLAIGDGREEPSGAWAISQNGPKWRRFTKRTKWDSILESDFGSGAHHKTIPTWIFSTSDEYRREFLRGYLAGDGTVIRDGHRANTVSASLASQLRLLAISLDMTSSLMFVKTPDTTVIEGRTVNQSDYYGVTFLENTGRYTRDKDGFRWTKQRRDPKPIGERTVYDITVEEDHSFTAWGYIVHNCQSYSVAGRGAGRKALDNVLAAIHDERYKDIHALKALGEEIGEDGDKTALVLTPLAYIHRYRPEWVAFEQVPAVLPVWEAHRGPLEEMGYSVWVGNIQAEMYGVAQTRKRAYLVARRDGIQAAPPKPTHSRYYSHTPDRLDEGVLPWVSMAEALGWGMTRRPSPTLTSHLGVTRSPSGTQGAYLDAIRSGGFIFKPVEPKASNVARNGIGSLYAPNTVNMDTNEGGLLNSFPDDFPFQGTKTQRDTIVGNAVPPLVARAFIKDSLDRTSQEA